MDATQLKSIQAPLKDKYKTDAAAAMITLKAKGKLAKGFRVVLIPAAR